MKMFILLMMSSFLSITLFAHPGIGLVQDSRGNIYYTDLENVWIICTDGKRQVVVPDVHTHELYIDGKDNLYGEHLWYNGEKLNTWRSYAWCLHSNGKLDIVVSPHEGFLENYSFNRDNKGNQYWSEHWGISKIKRKSPAGEITTLAEGKFKDIRWMHVTPAGEVLFIDLLDLYRIDTSGKVELVVKNLASEPKAINLQSARHSIFGLWTDKNNNIYAAVTSEKAVKKIDRKGNVAILLYSVYPWSPVSGLFDKEGNLWLMETDITNQVRVRKVSANELHKSPSHWVKLYNLMLPFIVAGGIIFLSVCGVRKLIRAYKKSLPGKTYFETKR